MSNVAQGPEKRHTAQVSFATRRPLERQTVVLNVGEFLMNYEFPLNPARVVITEKKQAHLAALLEPKPGPRQNHILEYI